MTTFKQFLIAENVVEAELTDNQISKLKSIIKKGAKDLDVTWSNALELVDYAYKEAQISIPVMRQSRMWKQFNNMISYAVSELFTYRGRDGNFRLTPRLTEK